MKWPVLFIALAAPASAQTFAVPAGCEAYLTTQNRNCEVEHHFTCENAPEGHKSRVTFTDAGLIYYGTIDAETQWIESHQLRAGITETLEPNPTDPASFSELLANNVDTYDFRTLSIDVGATRYVGSDRLTGNATVIDGVNLDETEFQITAYSADGKELWQSEGQEFISREWRMFKSGKSTVTTPDATFQTDGTPVQLIKPGEPGFLSIKPKFGCGALMSAAPEMQEYSHDNL